MSERRRGGARVKHAVSRAVVEDATSSASELNRFREELKRFADRIGRNEYKKLEKCSMAAFNARLYTDGSRIIHVLGYTKPGIMIVRVVHENKDGLRVLSYDDPIAKRSWFRKVPRSTLNLPLRMIRKPPGDRWFFLKVVGCMEFGGQIDAPFLEPLQGNALHLFEPLTDYITEHEEFHPEHAYKPKKFKYKK